MSESDVRQDLALFVHTDYDERHGLPYATTADDYCDLHSERCRKEIPFLDTEGIVRHWICTRPATHGLDDEYSPHVGVDGLAGRVVARWRTNYLIAEEEEV